MEYDEKPVRVVEVEFLFIPAPIVHVLRAGDLFSVTDHTLLIDYADGRTWTAERRNVLCWTSRMGKEKVKKTPPPPDVAPSAVSD